MTWMGQVRHLRYPLGSGRSLCGRQLCDDAPWWDNYPEHRDCRKCAEMKLDYEVEFGYNEGEMNPISKETTNA